MNEQKEKYYKKRYMICFYDANDEFILYQFDNINQILRFQRKEVNKKNANYIAIQIYKSQQRKNHFCKFLNGQPMTCQLIDMLYDEE